MGIQESYRGHYSTENKIPGKIQTTAQYTLINNLLISQESYFVCKLQSRFANAFFFLEYTCSHCGVDFLLFKKTKLTVML